VTTTVQPTSRRNPGPGRPGGTSDLDPTTADRVGRRFHLIAVSVALTVLTFVQTPGRIAPDTKADLSIDPVGFLLRAWHLWEPLGDSGQLQNQAYGYFVPMGPFYALGHLLGFPPWVVQRAWWALVLLVAFHGMYRLCRRFEVGNHPVWIIAGLAYALSPRMITEVGPVSIEAWPMSMAPWVLLPLVKVRRGDEPRAAAKSGLAVALCGGVNAVAVGATLILPVWWLITRERGPRKSRLTRWWALTATMGTFWWLAPLLLLGRYSPPFLDWVESSAVSTSKGTLPGAFRGTTQWVAWFKLPEPLWLAGWSVLSSPVGIVLGWLLITMSVLGMLRADTPNRRFLIGGSVAGLILLTLGHTGPLTAPWAPWVQTFMDGAGAPLRNTHKFDLVLRIPMTLALAHALVKVRLPAITLPGFPRLPAGSSALRFVAICALVGSVAPALVGQLPARGSFTKVPEPWRQAAAWLQENDDGARTLIVPGSSFDTSIWGDPHDEVFQSLARTKWATRSGVPLSSAGNIRMLNTIEAQLETGRGSPGLAEFLARAGISRVLLRSDLVRSFQTGSPPLPIIVRSALQDSPGLRPVVRFGPDISGLNDIKTFRTVADDGLDVPQPQIEIWQVEQPTFLAEVERAPDTLRIAGGPESLLTLAEAGRLGARPAILDGDPESAELQASPLAVTDTMQRREANFAQVRDNYSAPMTATQPYQQVRKVHDWLPFIGQPQVFARYAGISGVRAASQAASSVDAWHAVDGDTTTAWTSTRLAVGQWIEVTFPQAISLPPQLQITPGSGGARIAKLDVTTDTGTETTALGPSRDLAGQPQNIDVPGGATRKLRITVQAVWPGEAFSPVSIGEIALPGITPQRELVVPTATSNEAPTSVSLENARDGVDACVWSNGRPVCSPRLVTQSEDTDLDRVVQLPGGGKYTVEGTARIKATPTADDLVATDGAMTATASSRRANDPALRPDAALDRDPRTAWIASRSDPRPSLFVSWPQARVVSRLRWQMDPALAASRPLQFQLVINGKRQIVAPDKDGWVEFKKVRTKRIDIIVTGVENLNSQDRATRFPDPMPVGASEIVIPGADSFRKALKDYRSFSLPCGQGPALLIGDTAVRTKVTGTADDVVHRRPMSVQACDDVPALPAGPVRLSLRATSLLEPQQLVFSLADAPSFTPPATTAPTALVERSPEHREVTVARSDVDQVLVVHENSNPGWKASLDGQQLVSVRIDGWQQGWIVPAGTEGTVDLRFTPGNIYRVGMVLGLLLIAGLAVMSFPTRRRRRRLERQAQRQGLTEAMPMTEAAGRRTDTFLGTLGIVLIGGYWGAGALVAVLVAVRRKAPMRILVAGACAVAGIGAAFSINADERGFWGTASILASMVVLACMVVRLDAKGGRVLARASERVPAGKPGRITSRLERFTPSQAQTSSPGEPESRREFAEPDQTGPPRSGYAGYEPTTPDAARRPAPGHEPGAWDRDPYGSGGYDEQPPHLLGGPYDDGRR
jgi:arabinofuranan 3-O-arabinosyltransferase